MVMDYVGRRVLEMELPRRRKRGRPKRKWMESVKEDMDLKGILREDAKN